MNSNGDAMQYEQRTNQDEDGVVRKHVRGAEENEGELEDMFDKDEGDESDGHRRKYVARSRLQLK